MPRTNEDKRRALMKLLTDSEWQYWPQTKIASHALCRSSMLASSPSLAGRVVHLYLFCALLEFSGGD